MDRVLTAPGCSMINNRGEFNMLETIITTSSPSRSYKKTSEIYSHPIGKRYKNIINVIKFLNTCDVDNATLVIIITEWGREDTNYIFKLFPMLKCIDIWLDRFCNERFDIEGNSKITYKYGHPTEISYKDTEKVLLICNITCRSIKDEMPLQNAILHSVKPLSACLKLRPVFPKDGSERIITFYEGELHTVCFGKSSSLELRVYIRKENGYKETEYNLRRYEGVLFYYNSITRNSIFDGVYFDTVYYRAILNEYEKKYGRNDHLDKLRNGYRNLCSATPR